MVYDLASGRIVLFGGDDGGTALGDTWVLADAGWTQVAHFGAPACAGAAMVGTDVQVVLFGGSVELAGQPSRVLGGTWGLVAKLWTQRQDMGPAARHGHAMAFDRGRRAIVLFGGINGPLAAAGGVAAGKALGDTWEHVETDARQLRPRMNSAGYYRHARQSAPGSSWVRSLLPGGGSLRRYC